MKRYFAKPDTWFDENTEVFLREDYSKDENFPDFKVGLFMGQKTFDEEYARAKNTKIGLQWDHEVCSFDEFYIVDNED